MTVNAQNSSKILIADGITFEPIKYALQPTVKKLTAKEIEAVKKAALEKEVEFEPEYKQMSSEESNFRKDFELLDVAEGFFIYREIEFRAYLYTAFSQKMKRSYQGIIVLRILENRTKFNVTAHYVYEYCGDKYLRKLPDINGNILNELAIFSEPPTKKDYRRKVRIIEFAPNGLEKIGMKEIFSSVPQKQRMPYSSNPNEPAKRVYTPPKVNAVKLFSVKEFSKPLEFYEEKWIRDNDNWKSVEKLQAISKRLEEDKTNYIELVKPIFPKGPGEK